MVLTFTKYIGRRISWLPLIQPIAPLEVSIGSYSYGLSGASTLYALEVDRGSISARKLWKRLGILTAGGVTLFLVEEHEAG
ncbi:hypothetical protein C5167_037407 [Papaver somniferum]|uniref:Uncharacterized protein n=1 Tax=Papaver somniferum TaxID=3469 RepID=A0A4Y7IAN1_PAPSO|nr:hypothetical protein C5167_037407 [Papaver somniferum]